MRVEESPETRYKYEIWFPYTRQSMMKMAEGAMVAVPNFGSTPTQTRYSILEVTNILPVHFALNNDVSGYPGFVEEAAKNAAQDWTSQESEATDDTTKIKCVAIPTNIEMVPPTAGGKLDRKKHFGQEGKLAMLGTPSEVLDAETTGIVANLNIDPELELTIELGNLVRDDRIAALVRVEDLLRTHFAIFGFTGVGKSNLLSTLISKILADSERKVKLVLFDMMGEYTTLLVDQLLSNSIVGRILILGRQTLPEGLFAHINDLKDAPDLDSAAKQLARYTLPVKALLRDRDAINLALRSLIRQRRMKFYDEAQSVTISSLFFTNTYAEWGKKRQKEKFKSRSTFVVDLLKGLQLGDWKTTRFTSETAKKVREAIETALEKPEAREFKNDGDFTNHIAYLTKLEQANEQVLAAGINLQDLVADLNDESKSSLWIIQAHDANSMRSFSKNLGDLLYETRRKEGLIEPLVSFIFDEADEFIRQDAFGTYAESAEIAQTLARRGRKFGIGIGIATQRIRYLDTNIMSQPHTYLVSKLPMESDRSKVAQAFGVDPDVFSATFKFKKGDWLLMSYDAAGLEAVPIPIHTPDANERIRDYVTKKLSGG